MWKMGRREEVHVQSLRTARGTFAAIFDAGSGLMLDAGVGNVVLDVDATDDYVAVDSCCPSPNPLACLGRSFSNSVREVLALSRKPMWSESRFLYE